ncbi:conserved hypothetical protein [Treponema primitia ZAS-2]|uniref:Histidine kinase/HSP90-like ATPase domain-containing protein n=1 Tax=Treponema primitia (strain ATCC BAA-887 / DSM 12427 / ZAS-2) TaxID=545694 RepID=F5YJZ9_TREPZ|nr:ATP-binding protein [Treponema primitia]AEF86290.1 conserved hypothetical protein [Treponema primitia ZAS-2]
MKENFEIEIDGSSPLFDKTGMDYREFPSDFTRIRHYTMELIRTAPSGIRGFNLLEQQISEIIKNAVKHGNNNDPNKIVRIWYKLTLETAHLIVEDQGEGFKDLEKWNVFNRKRLQCINEQQADHLGDYVSFRGANSDNFDGGNALFAAVEYWNLGMVFNEKRNAVAIKRRFNVSKDTSVEDVLSDITPWDVDRF